MDKGKWDVKLVKDVVYRYVMLNLGNGVNISTNDFDKCLMIIYTCEC